MTLQIFDGIIPKIHIDQSIDGNEYAFGRWQRTRVGVSRVIFHKQKILPERERKGDLPSKGTGFISRYKRYSLQQEYELISQECHASLKRRMRGIWVVPRRLYFYPSSLNWTKDFYFE